MKNMEKHGKNTRGVKGSCFLLTTFWLKSKIFWGFTKAKYLIIDVHRFWKLLLSLCRGKDALLPKVFRITPKPFQKLQWKTLSLHVTIRGGMQPTEETNAFPLGFHEPSTKEKKNALFCSTAKPPKLLCLWRFSSRSYCRLWDYLRRSGQRGFFLPLSGGADSSSTAACLGVERLQLEDPSRFANFWWGFIPLALLKGLLGIILDNFSGVLEGKSKSW